MPLPEIDFRRIRGKAPSGSQADGFEDFTSLMMIDGGLVVWPEGTTFQTFGNPDGGREGRGLLLDGSTWCWQAKYLFELGDSEFSQIDKSVRRALTREPTLSRYYVVLPYDRPAGDTERKGSPVKSAFTKWTEHVEEWRAAALEAGLSVEFEYLGELQLKQRLMQPSLVGHLHYWFDLDGFSPQRYTEIAARAEADAGGRYTPELNVELPLAEAFEGLGHTTEFETLLRRGLGGLRAARGAYGPSVPSERPDLFEPALRHLDAALDQLDGAVAEAVNKSREPTGDLPDLRPPISAAAEALGQVDVLLQRHSLRDHLYTGNAASLYSQASRIREAVDAIRDLHVGRAWRSWESSAVLITGTGGSGKTHLLCDVAKQRVARGLPTLVVLGEQFEKGPIDADLCRIIGFDGPAPHLLATFDAACQAVDEIGLVIIDAVNESTDRALWRKYLGSLLNEISGRPRLRLVLSCRTEFLAETLPGELQDRFQQFRHVGFEEVAPSAIRQFLDWYGIERPTFPLLDPEFTNPFFLKLLCTTLQQRGEHRFPRTGIGTTWIYDSFLDAMDARLSADTRCDYDPSTELARKSAELVAARMQEAGRRLPKPDVEAITSTLLPGRTWSRSLLNGLLKEAVFAELLVERNSFIRFGYERLGDIALARLIASKDLPDIKTEVQTLADRWYQHSGVLQALASVLPETHGVEAIDLAGIEPTEFHYAAHNDFLLSLAWRNPSAISDRTVELVLAIKDNVDFDDATFNTFLQIAALPGHALNAQWLHQYLSAMPMPDRDATWSFFCDRQDEFGGHLPVLIDWAWSDASTAATDEIRHLVALILTWALSSSHRPTRDNSTKALTALLDRAPHVYAQVMKDFQTVDDDYIEERLLAVGCGIAQRSLEPATAFAVAQAVQDFTLARRYWPENLLSRDYARRTLQAALTHGWTGGVDDIEQLITPPYASTWQTACRSEAEIDALSDGPDYKYSTVSHLVMSDFDDFRKYVISSVIRSFNLRSEFDADHLARMVFDRVLELGWTPELFNAIDRNLPRPSSADGKKHEGYAQKYTWIALRQIAGRMTDRFGLDPGNRDDHRTAYDTPLDVYGHDIDPTMLLQRSENRVYADTPSTWFAPAKATFPVHLDAAWPTHDDHSPPVDQLLASTDDSGQKWLVLEGHYQWSQVQLPEDEAVRSPHHVTWAQIRSYLVSTDQLERWKQWAKGQDFDGRWMPESGSPTGLLLADHPYRSDWPLLEGRHGRLHGRKRPPGEFTITTTRYGGVATDWDQSHSKHLFTFMPSTEFCRVIGLQRVGDFRWGITSETEVEAFAARTIGPDSVHIKASTLGSALKANGQCLLWTILAEKHTTMRNHEWPDTGEPFSRSYSATFLYDGNRIALVDANTHTQHVGGKVSRKGPWRLLPEINT
ncbi:hypothetical protein F4553_008076 [Allocatelliglobosispora scoriae]|uniref:ATP-binding protein n=1 Tax=Allocatelliglobosispora scoriae TaxID=643052 RepID=A0A841C6C8_9ACTN|nr:ATP-binding protein [Allocatelliglobosispora scoriae]MBB5874642.1 hypothetical protein [Allocatelliglobosispora scoriae]